MIAHHQPTIFGPSVRAALSSRLDGNMKFGLGNDEEVIKNRQSFLRAVGIDSQRTTLVGITYATDDFAKYRTVTASDKGQGILAPSVADPVDALVTNQPGHALFLPIADCIGAVLYDSEQHVLMVSHLGRHSVEQNGAEKSVQYLKDTFSVDPADLRVWLSPGVGKTTYPLRMFDGRSLREVITDQLVAGGVQLDNIQSDDIDTATSSEYYSHSEFLKGNQPGPARFAIVAEMTVQGEPAA